MSLYKTGLILLTAASLAASASAAHSQDLRSTIGVGAALAVGETDDIVNDGYTVRGQVSKAFGIFEVTGQTGWTRLLAGDDPAVEDADLYHAGVGGRVNLGPLFGGVNAFYHFGDTSDKGFGLVPEVGIHIWRVELVADARFDHWVALRLGFRF